MDIAVSTSPAATFMLRKKNVWYTIADGNWNDPNIWMSNSVHKKMVTCPQAGDDVYVYHNIDYPQNLSISGYNFNNLIGNLFISGKLTCSSTLALNQCRLVVAGNLVCMGIIDFSTAINQITLELRGNLNTIANFNAGTSSTIQYNSPFDQFVAPVTYNVLEISNSGTKYLTEDLTVTDTEAGGLLIDAGAILELGSFNSYLSTTNLTGTLKKSSSTGVVNFNGSVSILGSTGAIAFAGFSPTINLSGNILIPVSDLRGGFNWGDGTLNVLTTQKWQMNNSGNQPTSMGNPTVIVASGCTLSINGPNDTGNYGGWWLNGTGSVNGADSTSKLNINSCFYFGNSATVMAIGTFNYNYSGTSQIGVSVSTPLILPFTSFYILTILASAVALSGNTTVNSLNINGGSLQLSAYDFTVSGTSTLAGIVNNSGAGTVNFNTISVQNSTGGINFSGNPTVNLSGNITGDVRSGFNFGTGVINIMANISFGVWTAGNNAPNITWNIFLSSGKTLTNIGQSPTSGGLTTSGTITGVDSTAVFINQSVFTYNNAIAPMETGSLYCNETANTFIYGASGNQDVAIPSDATPGYQNLTLQGSGVKRLLGYVSVKAAYALISPATLNSNGFALTNP